MNPGFSSEGLVEEGLFAIYLLVEFSLAFKTTVY